jgi:hypothetical protein
MPGDIPHGKATSEKGYLLPGIGFWVLVTGFKLVSVLTNNIVGIK